MMTDRISNMLNILNRQQYEAVVTTEGPLLILAGAGSGKTHTLMCRVAYLVGIGVQPEKILLLTFTNKAADEMKERAQRMADGCDGITACTYHSLCARMLRMFADQAGIPRNFTIITPQDAADIISMLKSKHEYNKVRQFPKSSTVAAIISASLNRNMTIQEVLCTDKYSQYMVYMMEILTLYSEYRKYKKERGLLDYDDLLVAFYMLLRDNDMVRARISGMFDYIMVDEYQDTNVLQNKIIFALRQENRNIAVVGDDSQSIYKFRGAEINNIINFPQEMPGCRVVTLENNYRSNQMILDLANYIMEKHATEGFPKTMKANHGRGRKPFLVQCRNQIHEADDVVAIIKKMRSMGVPLCEIAVLYRASRQALGVEMLLGEANIPYDKYGGIKFMQLSFVLDVMAYLRVIANPHDEIAWYRLLKLYVGIKDAYSQKISARALEKGERLLVENEYTGYKFYSQLQALYDEYKVWKSFDDPEEVVKMVIKHYKAAREKAILHMVTKDESKRDDALVKLKNDIEELELLPQMAGQYLSIAAFLDSISLEQSRGKERGEDRLVLSTIHSVKGLEFNTVIILDCVDGICPTTMEGDEEDNEELRCFYVAVTRAKENLFMMCPDSVTNMGRRELGIQSHYLDNNRLYLSSTVV